MNNAAHITRITKNIRAKLEAIAGVRSISSRQVSVFIEDPSYPGYSDETATQEAANKVREILGWTGTLHGGAGQIEIRKA